MSLYATLADVRSELNAESAADDAKVMRFLRQISRRIDQAFRSRVSLFTPWRGVRYVPIDAYRVNSVLRTFDLGMPMMDLTGITVNSQALTVGTGVQSFPVGASPFQELQLLGSAYSSWYTYAACTDAWGPQNATLTGIWGYNSDYANAWLEVDALAVAMTTTTATTFKVGNVDGENPYAETPRISAGHVVQIDEEWMDVVKTDPITNTVTVVRGVNGSTAAAHLIDSPVSVFLVEEGIRRVTARQSAFLYARQGAYNTITITDMGQAVQFPQDMLQEVQALLSQYANI
jgi:hypothetical protein